MIGRLMTLVLVAALVAWALRRMGLIGRETRAPRRGYSFALEFRDGRRTKVDGVVPRPVYNAFEDVAARARVTGRVGARRDGTLEFSDAVPEGVRQQFRNAWWAGRGA